MEGGRWRSKMSVSIFKGFCFLVKGCRVLSTCLPTSRQWYTLFQFSTANQQPFSIKQYPWFLTLTDPKVKYTFSQERCLSRLSYLFPKLQKGANDILAPIPHSPSFFQSLFPNIPHPYLSFRLSMWPYKLLIFCQLRFAITLTAVTPRLLLWERLLFHISGKHLTNSALI